MRYSARPISQQAIQWQQRSAESKLEFFYNMGFQAAATMYNQGQEENFMMVPQLMPPPQPYDGYRNSSYEAAQDMYHMEQNDDHNQRDQDNDKSEGSSEKEHYHIARPKKRHSERTRDAIDDLADEFSEGLYHNDQDECHKSYDRQEYYHHDFHRDDLELDNNFDPNAYRSKENEVADRLRGRRST